MLHPEASVLSLHILPSFPLKYDHLRNFHTSLYFYPFFPYPPHYFPPRNMEPFPRKTSHTRPQFQKKVLRSIIREFLLNDAQVLSDADFTMKHPDVVVEAITHLPQKAVEKNFETYKELLNIIRKLIGVRKCGTDFRKAICYIDYCHYRKA
jgi:hypothetical protein